MKLLNPGASRLVRMTLSLILDTLVQVSSHEKNDNVEQYREIRIFQNGTEPAVRLIAKLILKNTRTIVRFISRGNLNWSGIKMQLKQNVYQTSDCPGGNLIISPLKRGNK